jgi:uncharacterized protein (TIGR02646 family)
VRYIDIEDLEPPLNWVERAESARNALRAEIQAAEGTATASGDDAATARRQAIREGLEVAARQALWQELAPRLRDLAKGKCWYSESRNPGSDKNVDHFRPKGRVKEDNAHEGYWWLAFDWRNFRYACQWCNQRRNDKVNNTSGGKGDHFPLARGSFRAYRETDDCDNEDFDLLDPTDPDDWKLLTFRPDGHATPAKPEGTREHTRAAVSIEIYHLHCKEFVDERRTIAGIVERAIDELERALTSGGGAPVGNVATADAQTIATNTHMRAFYKRHLKSLLRLIHSKSEYSAAALAYARAAIYKREADAEVKREWLADILGSNS